MIDALIRLERILAIYVVVLLKGGMTEGKAARLTQFWLI